MQGFRNQRCHLSQWGGAPFPPEPERISLNLFARASSTTGVRDVRSLTGIACSAVHFGEREIETMRNFLLAFGVALLALVGTEPTVAQDNADLVGTWRADTIVLLESEGELVEAEREFSFVIESISGSLVRGFRTWKATDPAEQTGYVGDDKVTEAQEPFIGVLSSDGKTIHMVETQDRGTIITNVLSTDQIEVTYFENAPHPVVHTGIYDRVK